MRRNQIEQMTEAELAIRNAVKAVEAAGCDVRLTDAVILLQEAKDRVSDFVDGLPSRQLYGFPYRDTPPADDTKPAADPDRR